MLWRIHLYRINHCKATSVQYCTLIMNLSFPGYMRLQALIRSRILSHKFKHLRGHIIRLQARCRGYLIRREFSKKIWAIVTIQSHVRRMIAQRQYRKLRVN